MFLVHIEEFRDRNVNLVLTPNQLCFFLIYFACNSFSILVKFDWLTNWEWNRSKNFPLSIV